MAAAGCSDGDARLPSSLDAAKITSLPATAYYLPNFISEEEERMILDKVRPSRRLVLSNPALDLLQPC
jgi:alkylated DNA repair protein alkB family protein 6